MNSLSRQSNNMSMNASLNFISHHEERISTLADKLNQLQINLQNLKFAKFEKIEH